MERENERGNPSHTCREGNQCIGEVIHVFSEVTQHLGIHSEAIKKTPNIIHYTSNFFDKISK